MLLLWWLSMVQVISLLSWWKKFFISLVLSFLLFGFVVAEFRLNFEKFSISPLQAYSFRCGFSNNSVITFLEGCFPSSFVAEVGIFFSILLFQWSSFYSFFRRQCDVTLFDQSSHFLKIMFFFLLIHLTGVLCSHSSSFILSSLASLFNQSAARILYSYSFSR